MGFVVIGFGPSRESLPRPGISPKRRKALL